MTLRTLLLPALALTLASAAACARDSKPALFESATAAGELAAADSEATATSSTIRLVNALPGANGVEVTSGDLPLFAAVDYKSVTPYVAITSNLSRFRFRSASRDTTLTTNSALLADGSRYTVVAMPAGDGSTTLRVLLDELAPEEGKSRVRLVHAVRGESDVTATLGSRSEPLFEGLGFGMESGYRDIEPAEGTLVVKTDRTGRELLRRPLRLVSGHAYTIVITGAPAAKGGTVRRIDALVIDDQALTLGGTRDERADSLRRARHARRDSLTADSIAAQRDSADSADSAARDTLRRDSIRRDTVRDTVRDTSDTNLVRPRH